MDIGIDDLEITIEGEFNQAAFAGNDDDRTGLQDIAVSMTVDADADEDTVRKWAERSNHGARFPTTSKTKRRSN